MDIKELKSYISANNIPKFLIFNVENALLCKQYLVSISSTLGKHYKYYDTADEVLYETSTNLKDDYLYIILNDDKVLKNQNYELLSSADALILASGTVALEAALYETPMIISYKGPMYLYIVYRLVRCIKRVCLPNIIMDEDIVPELIQKHATPENVSRNILYILNKIKE